MNNCTVHKYKYSQESRRRRLKRLLKKGHVKRVNESKTHIYYEILNMYKYKECMGLLKLGETNASKTN